MAQHSLGVSLRIGGSFGSALQVSEHAIAARFRAGELHADIAGAMEHALYRLSTELDPRYVYHSLAHTRDNVLPAALRLAIALEIPDEARDLVGVAVCFHDIGFLEQRVAHENAGARIATRTLPEFGFTPMQIKTVVGMIMATQLPQRPLTLLEQVVADADLDVLARSDFDKRSHELREEIETFEGPMADLVWYKHQLGFLESHTYFTEPAQRLRAPAKTENVRWLRRQLAALHTSTGSR
ncbi:MAG: phosphohydrolase [Anaerolineae bacterium]|nr:phosphohydrolase [Anaerolineae bacterium]